jgi:hypothetical protein
MKKEYQLGLSTKNYELRGQNIFGKDATPKLEEQFLFLQDLEILRKDFIFLELLLSLISSYKRKNNRDATL